MGLSGTSKGRQTDLGPGTDLCSSFYIIQGVARGMCTDLDIWDSEPRLPEELAEHQHVEIQELSDLPGQPFAGFENMFFDEGGRAGGWRKKRRLV